MPAQRPNWIARGSGSLRASLGWQSNTGLGLSSCSHGLNSESVLQLHSDCHTVKQQNGALSAQFATPGGVAADAIMIIITLHELLPGCVVPREPESESA